MKSLLISLATVLSLPLIAESLENLEYQLPATGHEWKIDNQDVLDLEPNSTTLIYVPQELSIQQTLEVFVIYSNAKPLCSNPPFSLETLQSQMEDRFQNMQVKINPISMSDKEIFYEWTISKENKEELHGWTRAFDTSKGSAGITYQTEDIAQVDSLRSAIVNCLEQAKGS